MTDLEGLDEYEAKSVEKTDVSQKGGLLTEDYNEVSPKSRICKPFKIILSYILIYNNLSQSD